MQAPAQCAPLVPAPDTFKQEVDYKYDGLCTMRHLSKLIYVVNIMMSIIHLVQV